jgi:hypothetical protein
MDDNLTNHLVATGGELQRRAQELGQSGQESDTALLMQGLALTMEAIRSIEQTLSRLDGLDGLGNSGD